MAVIPANTWVFGGGTVPGGFLLSPNMVSSVCNATYLVFYFRVQYQGACIWTSPVGDFRANGCSYNGVWTMASGWTCESLCAPSADVTFPVTIPGAHAENQFACVTLCAPHTFTLCVGPLPPNHLGSTDYMPTVEVTPGCLTCDPPNQCTPASGYVIGAWVLTPKPEGLFYCQMIEMPAGAVGGCVCLHFTYILPVDLLSFSATPMDAAVKIDWATGAETNMTRFVVNRNGAQVASMNATGEAHTYSYTDESAANGTTYTYELVAVNTDNSTRVLATANATPSMDLAVVTEYALRQNFPNPFNPSTRIAFDVKEANNVTLTIFNAMGQKVATLLDNANYNKGRHSVTFDATNLTSGLYFYSVKIGNDFSATKKMLLVK